MLTNQQAIIAAQTRACARLQKIEIETEKRKCIKEILGNSRKEHT